VQQSQKNSNATYNRKSNEDHYLAYPTSRSSNAPRPTEKSQQFRNLEVLVLV
jgi:hypothetical protein